MRSLRSCPVTGRQVLVHDGWLDAPRPAPPPPQACWFCAPRGPVIAQDGAVRAVPHPVPAFALEADSAPRTHAGAVARDGFGAHELVWGAHVASEAALLRMVATRIADLRNDGRLRGFGAVRRHAAGHHAVWQIFAVPYDIAPGSPAAWRDRERASGERLIEEGAGALAAFAWAPRAAFEAWVLPSAGEAPFGAEDPGPVAEAAARVLARVARALAEPEIDLVLVDGRPWRLEIVPRLAGPTAVESALGVAAHGVSPEAAATHLRASEESP